MDLPQPVELSGRVKFESVAKRLNKIRESSKQEIKAFHLQKFMTSLKRLQRDCQTENANASLYPFLRLFLPSLDSERFSYGIQIKKLGKLIVNALAIDSKNSPDAKRLLITQEGGSSDYGRIVFEVMENRAPETSTLTVYDVNRYLDLIAEHFQQNERAKIDTEMCALFTKMTALECKWLVRIILKKLGLNLNHTKILNEYHPDAARYLKSCSWLSRVCEAIESGRTITEFTNSLIKLFQPIRPMLCQKAFIKNIDQMLANDEYYLETKMDGERYQIHIDGREFRYFSRNTNDFTKKFGSDSSGGNFTPTLARLLSGKLSNAILDGEMMVWNRVDDIFHIKSEYIEARNLQPSDRKLKPCFVIYDIIYLDDECLIGKPYAERVRLLRSKITERRGDLMFCERTKVENSEHFIKCLNKAFDSNEEGVVIKRADSRYSPGQRENGGWYKIKPDYESHLINDFDLLIIGAYYNETRSYIDQFLLGVFKKDDNKNDSGVFYSCCKTASGLSYREKNEICEKLRPHWKKVNVSKDGRQKIRTTDSSIELGGATPDFWIDPKQSIVVEIVAADLVITDTYRTSHTFRFPRIKQVRYDKPWHDACSLQELQQFCSTKKVEKLTKRKATLDDLNPSAQPLAKRQRVDRRIVVPSLFDYVDVIDSSCDGINFCILTDANKAELKSLILKHGGRVVENPTPSTTCICLADREKSVRVKHLIKNGKYDIVKTQWLQQILGDKPLEKLEKFTPKDMIYTTQATKELFALDFDRYGDSYTKMTTYDEMEEFLKQMPIEDLPMLTNSEMYEMELELSPKNTGHMFRLYTAHFYNENGAKLSHSMELARFIFEARAGNCVDTSNDIRKSSSRLTHIFVDTPNFDQTKLISMVQAIETEDLDDITVIQIGWILECHRLNEEIGYQEYEVPLIV